MMQGEIHIMFTRTARHNYNFFDISSAFQKAVRRGKTEEVLYCASELELSGLGNCVFTKLLLFCTEDIGLANPHAIVQVNSLHKKWQADKERIHVMSAAYVAARSKKSRMACTILPVLSKRWDSAWNKDPMWEAEYTVGDTINFDWLASRLTSALAKYMSHFTVTGKEDGELFWKVMTTADRLCLLESGQAKSGKVNCFLTLTTAEEAMGKKRRWRILWKTLHHASLKRRDIVLKPILDVLESCHIRDIVNPKARMYVSFALLLILKTDYIPNNVLVLVPRSKLMEEMDYYFSMETKMEIFHDYVWDKHTRKGKAMKRGAEHFRTEGSVVTNKGYGDPFEQESFEILKWAESLDCQDWIPLPTLCDSRESGFFVPHSPSHYVWRLVLWLYLDSDSLWEETTRLLCQANHALHSMGCSGERSLKVLPLVFSGGG